MDSPIHVCCMGERYTILFPNYFSNTERETADDWIEAFAFAWNQRIRTPPRTTEWYRQLSMDAFVSLLEVVLSELGNILWVPAFGFDVVGEYSINVFHGQDLVGCERTEDVWCRKKRIPVVENEIDE